VKLRRWANALLGVVLIVLGLLDYHVQIGSIVVGCLLLSGSTLVEIITLVRNGRVGPAGPEGKSPSAGSAPGATGGRREDGDIGL
jgi:hypothetical protein